MMLSVLPWCAAIVIALLTVKAPSQDGHRVQAAIQALGKDIPPLDQIEVHSAVQRSLLQRYAELLSVLRIAAPGMRGSDLAHAFVDLHNCAERIGVGAGESARVLAELESLLRARSGPPHGLCQLILKRSVNEQYARTALTQSQAWDQLLDAFEGPKRLWVGCEAARAFITLFSRPLRAEALLTQLLAEADGMPEWSETTRQELAVDWDLWIVSRERPGAGSRRDAIGQLLLLRGYAREQTGHLVPAIEDLQSARDHFAATGNEHRSINCDHNLASIWLQLGCHDKAVEVAKRAEERYRRGVPNQWSGVIEPDLNGVQAMRKVQAQALVQSGQWGEAEPMLGALATEQNVEGETNIDALTSYMEVLLRLPATADRVAAFDRQFERVRRACVAYPAHLVLWRAQLLVAERHLANGDVESARRILRAAEQPLQEHGHLPLQVRRQVLCADCDRQAGDPGAALVAYGKAAETIERAVAREQMWRLEGTSVLFAEQFGSILAGAHAAAARLLSDGQDPAPVHQALYDLAQHFHGFEALCRILIGSGDAEPTSPTQAAELQARRDAVRVAEQRFEQVRSQPAQHPIAARQRSAAVMKAQQQLEDAQVRLALFRVEFGLVPKGLAARSSIPRAQQCLTEGELLVECVEAPGAAFAFVMTRTECTLQALPSGATWQEVVRDLKAWYQRDERQLDAAAIPELQRCSEQLLAPDGWFARRLARGDIKRLLWSPEGSFGCVPLDALPHNERPLVDALAITHVISGSWLVQQRRLELQPSSGLRLLAMGNPRYREAAVSDLRHRSVVGDVPFSALPATAKEVLQVARLFADAAEAVEIDSRAGAKPEAIDDELLGRRWKVMLGSYAKESALAPASIGDRHVLHLACHGVARSDAPGMSYLALTLEGDAEQAEANGLLRLAEIARLNHHFELVTLSACQTSVGTDRGHDGVAGLAWAAQLAGARRVLATMWSVPDAPTSELVVEFYRHWLKGGMSCSDALAVTQRAAIGKWPVRVWAPFVLWGEAR